MGNEKIICIRQLNCWSYLTSCYNSYKASKHKKKNAKREGCKKTVRKESKNNFLVQLERRERWYEKITLHICSCFKTEILLEIPQLRMRRTLLDLRKREGKKNRQTAIKESLKIVSKLVLLYCGPGTFQDLHINLLRAQSSILSGIWKRSTLSNLLFCIQCVLLPK